MFHLYFQRAIAIDGASDNLIVFLFFHRFGFTCQHRLIQVALAFDHDAVGRDFFAGLYQDDIAAQEVFQLDINHLVPFHFVRLGRHHAHQQFQRPGSA